MICDRCGDPIDRDKEQVFYADDGAAWMHPDCVEAADAESDG